MDMQVKNMLGYERRKARAKELPKAKKPRKEEGKQQEGATFLHMLLILLLILDMCDVQTLWSFSHALTLILMMSAKR